MIPHDAGLPEPSNPMPPPAPREGNPIAGRIDGASPHRPAPPPLPAPPGLSAAPDLASLLAGLRRRWITAVLLGGALGTVAAAAAWFLLTPKATAFARIQVAQYRGNILGTIDPAALNDFKTYMQTVSQAITSRPVILGALKRDEVRRLGLDQDRTDPVQMTEEELKTEFKENSELLTVLFSHPDPVVATTLLQAVKNTYLEDIVAQERRKKAAEVTQLETVLNEKVEGLSLKKKNLKKVGEALGGADPSLWREQHLEAVGNLKDAKHQLVQIGLQLVDKRAALAVFESRLRAMGATAGAGKPRDARQVFEDALEEAVEADAEGRSLQASIARQQELYEKYLERFGPDYLSTVTEKNRLAGLKRRLEKRKAALTAKVRRALAKAPVLGTAASDDPEEVLKHLKKQVASLEELDVSLRKDVKLLAEEAARLPTRGVEFEQQQLNIKLEEDIVKNMHDQLERKKVELNITPRITSFQDADLMKRDIKKQVLATVAAPVAVFFAVGLGLAYVEHRRRRIRSAGEVSGGLGIRVVGAVPHRANLERCLAGGPGEAELEGTAVMESIDAIRTQLLHEADVRAMRVVMVTSATAGEGKTTLAAHLAGSLARAGRRTLLLDGDLRRPALHELFEAPMQPGFSEVLLGEIEVAEAAQETPQENLSLIPAGQWDREVLQALARNGLEGVFERLADEFDFIIIDSHPVLAATDSLLLGRQVDAVILSVLREVSMMPQVFAAQQQLTSLGVRVLGAVVNGADPSEVFTGAPAMAGVA
jgi:capsular exopolysaccharide synthesis family protein